MYEGLLNSNIYIERRGEAKVKWVLKMCTAKGRWRKFSPCERSLLCATGLNQSNT